MRNRSPFSALALISLVFIIGAVILFLVNLARFSRLWAFYPAGLSIGGVPVGLLDRQQADQRLLAVYTNPVELRYGDNAIQLEPSTIGFQLDTEAMLAAAEQERVRTPFWQAFWGSLWGVTSAPVNVPLRFTYSEERLRAYLKDEVAARYDRPPTPSMPQTGTVNFLPGTPGVSLDIERSILPIEGALQSPADRIVSLPIAGMQPPRPSFDNLAVLLRQTVELSGFDGVIGVYMVDLQTGQEVNFAYNQLQPIPMPPDVAFSASSTIKIPVMIAVVRKLDSTPPSDVSLKLQEMIAKSINESTDWLMMYALDRARGPLMVTEDAQKLGLDNTFLAGYFAPGSPLLERFNTPANQRTDIVTDPDPYNQTTPTEMGMLLVDLYQCAKNGGGALVAAFPGEITQAKCQMMLNYLAEDRPGVMIQNGLPDGTRMAQKHGWVTDAFYVIHNISDAAIVYTPGGDFVLSVYLYHPVQIVFEPANQMIADLARAAYNYYNLPAP